MIDLMEWAKSLYLYLQNIKRGEIGAVHQKSERQCASTLLNKCLHFTHVNIQGNFSSVCSEKFEVTNKIQTHS